MNYLQIKQRIAERTNKAKSPMDATTEARLGNLVNEAHRAILRKPGMEALRHGTLSFSSVAGQQAYAVPTEGIARVNRIWETTNDRTLEYRTLDWLREVEPDPQQGTPWAWIPTGYVDVHTQPSAAALIYVKSGSASDTATAYLEGYAANGQYRSLSVTMTGTTAVAFSDSVTFTRITKFYSAAAAVGQITLHQDSGTGTELARITIGKRRTQYYGFLLHDIPSAVVAYSADILRGIPDMTAPTDEPLLPEDFHDLLVEGALLKELVKTDDPRRWDATKGSYEDGLRDLYSFLTNHPAWRPTWGAPQSGRSRLGGWFPAGS